ncbi:MAG: Eco57I restriction-modification methylase domain-containing protein [Anaerolineaceae bacterium]
MKREELLIAIKDSISQFASLPFEGASVNLFKLLGYHSERRLPGLELNRDNITEHFPPTSPFKAENALAGDWKSIYLLFQLTEDDLQSRAQLRMPLYPKGAMDPAIYQSYVFLGVDLQKDPQKLSYTRSQLTNAVRKINKLFAMPAMVLFKDNGLITIGIIHRRPNKTAPTKDVLEKVTLIKDIKIDDPNRAHLEILGDLSINEITQTSAITNLLDIHQRWREILNTSELNKRFYKELFNWYCWAVDQVKFPEGNIQNTKERNAVSIIRLITRLIFVWFIKEKKLVPKELFDLEWLQSVLVEAKDESSLYYKAILQNLFFATLNTEMGKGRHFDGGEDNPCCYHYKEFFKNPEKVLEIFSVIPFLNGGLFESLDRPAEGFWVDGFTNNSNYHPTIPDILFFEKGVHVDLSEDYGTKGHDKEPVRGLIRILNGYKFTIEENTPLDEEIALDPELLGKVFENLLAAYNPDTGVTARKLTGSFYTPREIVEHMVDESLISYFADHLGVQIQEETPEVIRAKVRQLVTFSDIPHIFPEEQVDTLIHAVNTIKVLDPAVGSGAFPMVVLNKLVYVLTKLDPHNKKWEEKQISDTMSISDVAIREHTIEEIRRAFNDNEMDYGRKLYLIQKCLFGVDIQPVAVQIAKLRFFISLVVDQVVNENKQNLGLIPLPNLESKFVAANSLIEIMSSNSDDSQVDIYLTKAELSENLEKLSQVTTYVEKKRLLDKTKKLREDLEKLYSRGIKNPLIAEKESELALVRERAFTAHLPEDKKVLRKRDKEIREELTQLLQSNENWDTHSAKLLSQWNPYDQNTSATFFDKKWMLGVSGYFDIVIGNPPYIKEYTNKDAFDGLLDSPYYQGKMDIWYFFACKGLDLVHPETGILAFIATNNWTTNAGASVFRDKVARDAKILQLIDFGDYKIFESADIQTMVMLFKRGKADRYYFDMRRNSRPIADWDHVSKLLTKEPKEGLSYMTPHFIREEMKGKLFVFSEDEVEQILEKISSKSNFNLDSQKEVAQGIVPNPDNISASNISKIPVTKREKYHISVGDPVFVVPLNFADTLDSQGKAILRPLYEPSDLSRYYIPSAAKKRIIYITKKNGVIPPPCILGYLEKYKDIMEDRRENQTGQIEFYQLHWPRDEKFFTSGPKILSVRKCERPFFVYTENPAYVMMAFNVIISSRVELKYLTAYLNSSCVQFWLKHKGKMQGSNYQVDKEPLLGIPIFVPDTKEQSLIINLVDQIFQAKKVDPNTDTIDVENLIDQHLFKLLELTPEDQEVIIKETH